MNKKNIAILFLLLFIPISYSDVFDRSTLEEQFVDFETFIMLLDDVDTNITTCDNCSITSSPVSITTCTDCNITNQTIITGDVAGGNTTEQIQDAAWDVLGGTQTRITVTYDDAGNAVNFVVDDMTSVVNTSYEYQLNSTLTLTFNSTYDALTPDTNATTACVLGEYLDGGGSCLDVNNTIDIRTNSTTYFAGNITTNAGTYDAGNVNSLDVVEDGDSYNVSEAAGANPLEIVVNFTGVVTFDNVIMREFYSAGEGHEINVELFHYEDNTWELIDEITDMSDFSITVMFVPDPLHHINATDGNVTIRFRHVQNGNPSHDFFIDYLVLVDGFTPITSSVHDSLSGRDNPVNHPWAFPIDASRVITGHTNITNILNVTGNVTLDGSTLFVDSENNRVGINTTSPDSVFHIKADIAGVVGSHSAGQLIIQNPADTVFSNVVITAYESDGSGNPDQQLWYLGSSSSGNTDIIFLNRRNAKLQLGTSGTSRITILGNGNVGINTTTPTNKLNIIGDFNVTNLTDSPALFVDSQSRVGIGTINPSQELEVSGDGANILLTNTNVNGGSVSLTGPRITIDSSTDAVIVVDRSAPSKSGVIRFLDAGGLKWEMGSPDLNDYSGDGSDFFIGTTSDTPLFLIDTSGNVGIGTNAPDAPLEVSSNSNPLMILFRDNVNADAALRFEKTGVNWTIGFDDSLDDSFAITNAVDLTSGHKFVIQTGGSVGVGTNDPQSLLHLKSSGLLGTFRLEGTAGAIWGFGATGSTSGQRNWFMQSSVGQLKWASMDDNYIAAVTDNILVLKTDGSIGIGTNDPEGLLHVKFSDTGIAPVSGASLVLEDTTSLALQFLTATNSVESIYFGDGADFDVGWIRYDHSAEEMNIRSGAQIITTFEASRVGIQTAAPAGTLHVDQLGTSRAIPTLILDQADVSEGFINFIGADTGVINEGTSSLKSVRVELGGVVYRLALYAD